jgi:hypothetical protein
MTVEQATIKQSSLSVISLNKHISMAMKEYRNNGREVLFTVHDEML